MARPALQLIILLLFSMAATLSGTHVGWCLCAEKILANQECPCPCSEPGGNIPGQGETCGDTPCSTVDAPECRTNCVVTLFKGELTPLSSIGFHDPLPAPVTAPLGPVNDFASPLTARSVTALGEASRGTDTPPAPNVPLFLRHRSLRT